MQGADSGIVAKCETLLEVRTFGEVLLAGGAALKRRRGLGEMRSEIGEIHTHSE
jgi:hypothetical protein